jgi:hypothetical protein
VIGIIRFQILAPTPPSKNILMNNSFGSKSDAPAAAGAVFLLIALSRGGW